MIITTFSYLNSSFDFIYNLFSKRERILERTKRDLTPVAPSLVRRTNQVGSKIVLCGGFLLAYLSVGEPEAGGELPPVGLGDVLLHLESLLQPLPLQVREDGARPRLLALPARPNADLRKKRGGGESVY